MAEKVRIAISPDGKTFKVNLISGTFAAGKEILPAFAQALGAVFDLDSLPISEVEQHRHDDQPVHTHEHDHISGGQVHG